MIANTGTTPSASQGGRYVWRRFHANLTVPTGHDGVWEWTEDKRTERNQNVKVENALENTLAPGSEK